MDRHLTLLAVLGALAWSPAYAADPAAGKFKDCSKIENYNEMVDCAATNASAGDAEVTRTYEALLHKLVTPLRRDLLATSQAAWQAYRAAYCSLVSSAVEGGTTLQPMVRNACHAELAKLRIRELEHQLTCREGDAGCITPARRP